MENKSNSLNRIKRHQREKVLRFSIRKYSFGAASVAVAALMFLGAHAVSADVVDAKNQPAIGAANPNEEKSPLIESAPKSKNEETKETEKVEVAKETKEREKTSENKEAVEANPLNNGTSTSTITVTKDASGDKVTEKQTLDKSQLQASITKVQELLDKVNKEKAPASTLAAIQADLEKANSVLNNNSLELTQAEIDAVAKKLNEKIFVLSSMPKAITPEKVVKEGKNTIANTGSHDSRNGQRMGEGVSFRANDVRVEGALYNVKEYISEPSGHGSTAVGQRTRTIDKTFMTARYSKENGMKFITYDVYFQNDGKALDGYYRNAFWFYPPRDLLPNVGRNYPIGVVSDAYYERYQKKAGATGTLSENPSNFTQVGGRYTVSLRAGKGEDDSSERLWGNAGGLFQFGGGPTSNDQRQQMLKQLQHNRDLNGIIKSNNNPDGSYPTLSYSHLLTVGSHQNFAYKYHVKMRLRDDVTDTQAQRAGAMAVTAKEGFAKTALAAYVYAATGTSLLAAPSINTLTKYNGTLVSTDRVISGTGVAGAKITLTMQDGTPRTIHVDNSGRWSYTLKQNEKLTQNTRQDASIKSPNTISAKQTKNGEESSATSVNVQLARAISIDTPLQAGRDISVKVAHDTGRFYIQVRNAANTATVYEYGVIQENGSWRIENSAAANAIDVKVTDGDTPSEKKITLHVNDSHRKNNIPFKITKDHVVRVRSHHVHYANIAADPGHENDGWVTAAKATNTNPTIAIKDSNATYTSDGTLTKDKLKTLVTVNDAEDTPGKTVGNTAAENLDVKATKDGKNVDLTKPLKQGTYNLTYSTTDAAGAIATKNHTITVNYAAVAKSKINLVQEESVSDELKRSLLELRDGNDKVAIPNNARVEVTLDTSAKADSKTAVASVVLQGKTIASTNITYRVLPTFPIAHTVYDFKGVNRSDDESKYYLNTGIPRGMKWFAKRGNEAEIDASGLRDKINADPVGETTYKFGGKYNYGRFTDSPQPNEKLEHAATFTHKVFDIKPNDTKVTVAQGGTLSEAQAISAVAKVTGSPDLPSGTTYEWVDDRGNKITPTANTAGVQNFKVKVTLPPAQSGNDAPEATRRQPSKIIAVPVNITPPAPTVTPTINNMVTSTDRVLRGKGLAGAKVKVTVNTTPLPEVTVGRDGNWAVTLPKGLNSNHAPSQAQLVNKDPLKVTQSVDGVDSPITNVTVAVGETKVQPTVENGTSVYAGAKMITVKAPHDAGIFYVKYREKDSNQEKEIGIKRDSISGPWTSIAPERGVVTVSVNKDRFTDTVTIEMKESIKEGSISAVANIRQGGYSSPYSWKATPVTNDAPTLTSTFTGPKKVVEYGSAFNPTELVRASDKEDDTGLTRGTGRVEVVSVNGNTGNKTVNTSQTGTYTVRLKATDSQGKVSAEKDVTIEVTKNHQAVAKPVVNLKVGETLTPAEKRSLIELQEGNGRVALPDDAIVEVNLDTSAKSNSKQTKANVRFKDGTVKNVNLNYKVLQTFPVATKVYDFNGVARNQNEDAYYSNTGLPDGFNWFVRQNGTAKPDGYIQNYLRDDSVGTTDYVYGAKYREGRFTNNAPESDRLEHSGTVSHTVFDVGANTTRVMVKSGTSLADSQAKDAVMAVNGSEPLPKGTTYEWVNQDGTPLANKQVTEKGEAVRYVKVTLPKTAEDGPVATQYRSSKIVRVIINESEKPRVSFNGSELSTDASNENSKFVIFRGATFDPTFTVSDNSGKVTEIKASGLPSGREFVKNTDTPNGNVQITGNDITATSNATLGDHIGKVLVKDALGNEQEYQFKYTVVDIKIVENPKTVPINTKLGDSHFHVRLVNSDATDATSQEGLYPTNTKFKWKKENNGVSNETVLSEPGKITGYKAVVESPAARAGFYTKNGVKIYMPASIERDITFLVKPNDIIRYSKNGDDVDKTTTTHTVDPNTGKITPTPNTVTHQKDGAKDTVVTQTIPVTTRYEPDETKDVGINTVVNNGSEGSIVTTTPKLVNEITGEVTNGTPVVRKTEMVPKVVKVGTKPKVVETPLEKPVRYVADPTQPKGEKTTETEGEDGKVVTTTHYTVNPDGSVTEGETTSVRIEPKEKVVKVGTKEAKLTPTVELDQDPDTGEVTVTPKKPDGTLYPENTKVEIPGKDKDHPITVTLGKDGKGKVPNSELPEGKVPGTSKITVPGKPAVEVPNVTTPSKLIPTVALDQDPDTGEVTVTPKKPDGTLYPENTKVEIPGKDKDHPITITIGKDGTGKVPNSELPEGKVPGTGKITVPGKPAVEVPNVTTPSKVTPTVELDQDPDTGEVTVTPKKPDGTLYPENTKVEIPGKDKDHPITITIGKDGTGKVPNDKLPKKAVPGTGTVTEPNKKPSQPVNVTTPAHKTPTLDVERDPNTGDVTVTPKRPDGSTYPPGTMVEIPGKDKDHPITVAIGEDGTGKVPNSDLPDVETPGTGKITEPGKPAVEVPVVTTPAKLKTSENGELPDPITLPELTIEVRWIDEDGNVLKPSVKTGEADATAHGSIPGYEFVRTIIDENEPVITHIFRKVSGSTNPNTIPVTPVTPDTNGGSGQDAPAPTTPVPDAVTPNADQVDTKTTVDNGAKSNGSQNVLPNTGTESNATLASLGLLGMLGGLGLALAKKKED